ncbi:MAG: sporulation integral membrane protein YlbJ [Clostridiales bacterium]|nr:sporulation integral membrane protein YlbJ [Clostridiales bacterium]
MITNKFFVLVFKKNFFTILFTLFLIFLLVFSQTNIFAVENGLTLWTKHIIPSLFPFFIATELLNYTKLPYYLGKLSKKFMRPLFNIPSESSYAFIMGIISGYPIGAKIINNFLDNKICTKSEAERMLSFTNNSGPLFVIGTIGICLYNDIKIGLLLFITHILASITVGIIFGLISKKKEKTTYNNSTDINSMKYTNYNLSDLGTILSTSITNAISTIFIVGGFIVLFSIIISILSNLKFIESVSTFLSYFNIPYNYSCGILTGLIELTNGVNLISSLHVKNMSSQIIITSFLLGFAGLSIFLQIFSIASKHNLSIKYYLIGKLLQGAFASLYTYIILYLGDFFYFNI